MDSLELTREQRTAEIAEVRAHFGARYPNDHIQRVAAQHGGYEVTICQPNCLVIFRSVSRKRNGKLVLV